MDLSIRLQAIADCVQPGLRLADIGTDHGYLPIELVQRGQNVHILACDVRTGPLERAKAHIQQCGMEQQVKTRLSSGFAEILPGEVDGAVIAGMGGMLIAEILQAEKKRPKNILKEMKQLILQPQSDWETVRRTLHELQFQICDEKMVVDRGKYYWILICAPGEQTFAKSWQYRYGAKLAERQDPIFNTYLEERRRHLQELMGALGSSEGAARRRKELAEELVELEMLKSAMKTKAANAAFAAKENA